MKKISSKMYFDSDDDFYKFCVVPELVPIEDKNINGETKYYFTFNLSDAYNNALADGRKFVIKDPNSQIFKHQAVSYRTITKDIDNLEEYFEDI